MIREYQSKDLDAVRAIHAAQGFAYPFPDLNNPLFVTKLVVAEGDPRHPHCHFERRADEIGPESRNLSETEKINGSNKIVGAALLRLTAEAYLLLDPRAGTPRERWNWLLALHAAAERDAWQRGLEDVHAWLPPGLEKKFGRRLERLGWVRDAAWTPYCKKLEAGK